MFPHLLKSSPLPAGLSLHPLMLVAWGQYYRATLVVIWHDLCPAGPPDPPQGTHPWHRQVFSAVTALQEQFSVLGPSTELVHSNGWSPVPQSYTENRQVRVQKGFPCCCCPALLCMTYGTQQSMFLDLHVTPSSLEASAGAYTLQQTGERAER